MKRNLLYLGLLSTAVLTGCNSKSEPNSAGSSANNQTSLTPGVMILKSGASLGDVTSLSGTYTNCQTTNQGWSIGLSFDAGSYNIISSDVVVFPHETSCVLTITSFNLARSGLYTSSTGIPLGGSFAPTAVTFNNASASLTTPAPATLYGNGFLSDPTFSSSNITMQFSYSDTPNNSNFTGFPSIVEAVSQADIPPPSYKLDSETSTLVAARNATDNSISITGNLSLTAESQTGESYVIVPTTVNADFGSIANAYNAAAAAAVNIPTGQQTLIIPGPTLDLPAGQGSPAYSTVIIKHSQDSLDAYEVITIPFH